MTNTSFIGGLHISNRHAALSVWVLDSHGCGTFCCSCKLWHACWLLRITA